MQSHENVAVAIHEYRKNLHQTANLLVSGLKPMLDADPRKLHKRNLYHALAYVNQMLAVVF